MARATPEHQMDPSARFSPMPVSSAVGGRLTVCDMRIVGSPTCLLEGLISPATGRWFLYHRVPFGRSCRASRAAAPQESVAVAFPSSLGKPPLPCTRWANFSYWASELNENSWGWRVINGTCDRRHVRIGKGGDKRCEELSVSMQAAIPRKTPAPLSSRCDE